MPKENKKRGRRAEKKRKHEDEEDVPPTKRQKSEDAEDEVKILVHGDGDLQERGQDAYTGPGEVPFYGLLSEDEQEYFKRADSLLELNQFADAEERNLFLANVYKEANGKELKIANSQSSQLKALFREFNGHFLHLVQHRFASHCCQTLFRQSAQVVTDELLAPLEDQQKEMESGEPYVSMESLFLYTVNELEGNLGYLMTDQFASHALRVLLIVLSGQPLANTATTSLLQSKKKEKIDITGLTKSSDLGLQARTVPDSFQEAVDKVISGMITGLDTTYVRALAAHPVGNPVLQLLIELELSQYGRKKAEDTDSLFRKLLPDDSPEEGTDSASFINGLLYDAVGSRLLETIIRCAPGRTFKPIYRSLFRERLGSLARNEIAGYVVIRVLERLGKEDLEEAVTQICPQTGSLIERSRTTVIKTLIERCAVRGLDTKPIADALVEAYGEEPSARLSKLLKLNITGNEGMSKERQLQVEAKDGVKLHGSLLAQAMLEVPGPLRELISQSLLAMDTSTLVFMAKDRTATHVLQRSLTCSGQGNIFCRKILQKFLGHIADLAVDAVASHVVDVFWTASGGLQFIRERMAEELLEKEKALKESYPGRAVWRNWMMDLNKRRKSEWISKAKGAQGKPDQSSKVGMSQVISKSGIELARERFAAAKAGKSRNSRARVSTGANGAAAGVGEQGLAAGIWH
ncbi:Pumilio RNA-binding repeat [Lasallia pustulata]|uniref:Nucleolar protein 9 n=1 Tax=Lasallia pustulata TaxID=136370 RepID=A0A1W5D0D4_9LECA|nr:Pumilio RNA-binding repeat [Lasallia pustulata]